MYQYNANQDIITNAVEFLKRLEVFKATPYKSLDGVEKIGYGFSRAVKLATPYFEKGSITKLEAENILKKLCIDFYSDIMEDSDTPPVSLHLKHNELVALISFVYNVGLKTYNSSTLKSLVMAQQKDFHAIYNKFLQSNKITVNDVKIESEILTSRRMAEANLFCQTIIA